MLSKLNLLSLQKHLSVWRNSPNFQSYHREVTNSRKTVMKPNNCIGHHRVLDALQTINPKEIPSHRILRKDREAEKEKGSEQELSKISFSHRAVVLRKEHPRLNAEGKRDKQMEINRLTNYFAPKVYKLKPSQISQSIVMRSKLAKLLPKKELQPKLYPRSSILMQKHLQPLNPCENYKKKRNIDKILDQPKEMKPKLTNWRGMEVFGKKANEKTSFFEQALKMVQQKQLASKEIMSPLYNLMKYAKSFANSGKSK